MENLVTTVATGSMISEGVMNAFSNAVTQIQSAVGDMVATALPPALFIAGTFLVIGLGVKFFKSIAH